MISRLCIQLIAVCLMIRVFSSPALKDHIIAALQNLLYVFWPAALVCRRVPPDVTMRI